MMHSIALDLQSVQLSDDYILVQQPGRDEFDSDGFSNCSYDYCDDAFSVHSEDQTLSVSSEVDCDHSDDDMELTVPSVLMRNLDEAHAAAKDVQIRESEDPSDISGISYSHDDTATVEARDDNSVDDNPEEPKKDFETDTPSLSRASNKKRRKKLKLMKKALAAANAAQVLAECSKTTCTATTANKKERRSTKKKAGTTRTSKKKVANIAVACATATYASYREDLRKTKHVR